VDAAADWIDHSPMVERIVDGTIRSEDKAEQSRWRVCLSERNALQQRCQVINLVLNHGGTKATRC